MPEGIPQFQQRYGIEPSGISYLTHGTTVGVNAVVQRKGLKLALFATDGFCDVLEVAGLKGGRGGANSQFHRNRGQPDEEVLGNRDIGHCNPGDVIRIIAPAQGAGAIRSTGRRRGHPTCPPPRQNARGRTVRLRQRPRRLRAGLDDRALRRADARSLYCALQRKHPQLGPQTETLAAE